MYALTVSKISHEKNWTMTMVESTNDVIDKLELLTPTYYHTHKYSHLLILLFYTTWDTKILHNTQQDLIKLP